MERKDTWEKLVNLPNEQEVNPDLAKKAIEQFEKEQNQPKKSWFSTHWKYFALPAAVFAVCIAISVPLYNSLNKPQLGLPSTDSAPIESSPKEDAPIIIPPIYYDSSEIETVEITDIESFLMDKSKKLYYYKSPMSVTKAATLRETNEFAFLAQEMMSFDESGFDSVKLWGIVLDNAEFEFMNSFTIAKTELFCDKLKVFYLVKDENAGFGKMIRARFMVDEVNYFLEIITDGEVETKILQYVNMLVNKI